jgi:hypothetical protein
MRERRKELRCFLLRLATNMDGMDEHRLHGRTWTDMDWWELNGWAGYMHGAYGG